MQPRFRALTPRLSKPWRRQDNIITFKHLPLLRKLIFSLPPDLAIKASAEMAGLTNLQVMLWKQVIKFSANPQLLKDAPHRIICHRLFDPEAYKGEPVPNRQGLYEEAQALMFGSGDTRGNTLMVGFNNLLKRPDLYTRLRAKCSVRLTGSKDTSNPRRVRGSPSSHSYYQRIPSRFAWGQLSPFARCAPHWCHNRITRHPRRYCCWRVSGIFAHSSSTISDDPQSFKPACWTPDDASRGANDLEQWLVTFSRGPGSCLGINLAWCKLYITFARMLRVSTCRI